MRQEKDMAIKKKRDFLEKRRFNQLSKDKRIIWMAYEDKDTPCSKIAKYFNQFILKEIEDIKHGYKVIMQEINTAYEDEEGNMDEQ